MSSLLRRASAGVLGLEGSGPALDPAMKQAYPILHAYMTENVWPDEACFGDVAGKPRKVATLLVFTELGQWKAVLNDRAQGLSLWATSDSHEGLMGALDELLASDTVPWRKARDFKEASSPIPNGHLPAKGKKRK